LSSDATALNVSDYGFLSRFLDVTKANLFFARGIVIVEGEAENILIPAIARALGRDFTSSGISIVNVGGLGLRRFARIYQRKRPGTDGTIAVPVACVADMDVMPDCAPEITKRIKPGDQWPEKAHRRWRAKGDFTPDQLIQRRADIRAKASGQRVETFVADEWTLEYDLAYAGLARDVWLAVHLADADERISEGKVKRFAVIRKALRAFVELTSTNTSPEELASRVYAPFLTNSQISKATAAQYLAWILEGRNRRGQITPRELRGMLPRYIVEAIEYVTPTVDRQSEQVSADEGPGGAVGVSTS
jgi:putative ATP-dependent endonuclease of OLD family